MSNANKSPESGVAHRRPVPEAWPQLVAPMNEAPGSIKAAQEVWDIAKELDVDELDENRYYAIGRAMCCYARDMKPVLADPVQRQALVDEGARAIVDKSIFTRPTVAIEGVLRPRMARALWRVPPSERVVGDILDVQKTMRPRFPMGIHSAAQRKFFEDNIPSTVNHGRSVLAEKMKRDVLGAVGIVDNIVSEAQTSRRYRTYPANAFPAKQDIDMLRTPHTLLWLKKLAARVPLEQAQFLFLSNIVFDEDANGIQSLRDIDWKTEQAEMDERAKKWAESKPYLRTKKLVCPAMHVDGMIEDNLALTIDMLDAARQL